MATKVITGPVRLSYANIWTPRAVNPGDDPKYSTAILIPKSDTETVAKIEAAIEEVKETQKDKWGGKVPPRLKTPLRDGDEDKPDDPTYKNMWFLNANSNRKPQIVDKHLNPITEPDEVYSGCWARVSINLFAYNTQGNRGIGAGLNNVMKWKDDATLGGAARADEDFAEIAEADEDFLKD